MFGKKGARYKLDKEPINRRANSGPSRRKRARFCSFDFGVNGRVKDVAVFQCVTKRLASKTIVSLIKNDFALERDYGARYSLTSKCKKHHEPQSW